MANLMPMSQLPFPSDQTVPSLACNLPHQETQLGEIYLALDQREKVVVENIHQNTTDPDNFAESLTGLDMLEQIDDYQEFLSKILPDSSASVTRDTPCITPANPVPAEIATTSRQCTEESDANLHIKVGSDQDNKAELFDELDLIMNGEETIEVQQTAAEIFRRIENCGQLDDRTMDSHSDCSTEVGLLSDSQSSEGSQSSWEHRTTMEDEDLQMICANLESQNNSMPSSHSDFLTVDIYMDANTGVCANSLDKGVTILPKFPVLLGEPAVIKGDPSMGQDRASSPRSRRSGTPSSVMDDDYVSATDSSFNDSDDDFRIQVLPKNDKRAPNASRPPHAAKRSRRRSPKLWMFILDALCDPKLNPTTIRWENKQRGLFKIEDTKKLSDLWGCRSGKTIKPGSRHNMTYEKFSRAMRYYYKDQVLSSVPGRLTYQFGPNATGWRAQAQSTECKR